MSEINNTELSYEDLSITYKLIANGDYKEALTSIERLSQKFPDNYILYDIGGQCYYSLKQYELAIECYDESIKINPDNADTLNNRGDALGQLLIFDEAISCIKKAIKIRPDFDLAFFNLGVFAMHLRLYDLSINSFDVAIQLRPNFAKYKYGKSILLLLYGDFRNAWVLFESRWKLDKLFSPKLETNRPLWTGNKKAKLLVWPEQGVGDHIMYSALLPDLKKKCSNLIVLVDPRLVSLLRRSMGDLITFYPDNVKVAELEYDEHIAIGSLCQYLRNDDKDFKSTRNGFLKDDKIRTSEIKKNLLVLNTQTNKKICGISWRSQTPLVGHHKSIHLKDLIEVLDLKGYTFVSLQYGDTADEIKEVKDKLGIDVISYEKVDNFNDIDGLTSLIQACDVVISICNVTCQLAGGLGKEIHVILTFGTWWGWGVGGPGNPWHSSVNIYRQEDNEQTWHGLFKRLKLNLKE